MNAVPQFWVEIFARQIMRMTSMRSLTSEMPISPTNGSHVQLLTNEMSATRALGAVFNRESAEGKASRLSLGVEWLRRLGIECDEVVAVTVEDATATPGRRADLHFVLRASNGTVEAIVEAKLDAPIDVEQLRDALRGDRHVISLVPAGIRPNIVPGVTAATWEDLIEILRRGQSASEVSAFVADELEFLLASPRILHRRRVAELVGQDLPDGWTFVVDESTAGGALLNIEGPRHRARGTSIEISDAARGRPTELRAQVMAYSTTDPNDPIVWSALARAAADAPTRPACVTLGQHRRRTSEEREAAEAAGVPAEWTYGYGRRQFEKYGWAGFGPRFQLADGMRQDTLVKHAIQVAGSIDAALAHEARTAEHRIQPLAHAEGPRLEQSIDLGDDNHV